jgi:hypothetical protein
MRPFGGSTMRDVRRFGSSRPYSYHVSVTSGLMRGSAAWLVVRARISFASQARASSSVKNALSANSAGRSIGVMVVSAQKP